MVFFHCQSGTSPWWNCFSSKKMIRVKNFHWVGSAYFSKCRIFPKPTTQHLNHQRSTGKDGSEDLLKLKKLPGMNQATKKIPKVGWLQKTYETHVPNDNISDYVEKGSHAYPLHTRPESIRDTSSRISQRLWSRVASTKSLVWGLPIFRIYKGFCQQNLSDVKNQPNVCT